MKKKIAIVKTEEYQYPINPELIKRGFELMGWDEEHINTLEWNPLGRFIKPGYTVLLKPNLVMDKNQNKNGGVECLYTQPSIVKEVLVFVIKALQGNGRIVIGDAPLQNCDFEKLIRESGYLSMIESTKSMINNSNIRIELVDFREFRSVIINSVNHPIENKYQYSGEEGITIKLNENSEFATLDDYQLDNIRITGYDHSLLRQHHNKQIHEYRISRDVLSADFIINIPKPKTHRFAGATIGLKNLVGINARKEFLPHHTNGSVNDGGDEYLHNSFVKKIIDHLEDVRNRAMQTEKKYFKAWILLQLRRTCTVIMRKLSKDTFDYGSWYGNDTISKTITDLNKILFYADKNGVMQEIQQRNEIIIADMIISGDHEGPLAPSPKKLGIIAIGDDPVCFDWGISYLMGMKTEYFNTLKHAKKPLGKYQFYLEDDEPFFVSNDDKYNNKMIYEINKNDLWYFIPSKGWEKAYETKTDGHTSVYKSDCCKTIP